MRLVIEYAVGDTYTWGATTTVPVEYESAEAFAVDFEAAVREHSTAMEFGFAGTYWDPSDFLRYVKDSFVYDAPDILTVDEWFSRSVG